MKRRTVTILIAIVVVLAAVVAFDQPRRREEGGDRVLPGFDTQAVERIDITGVGRPAVALERRPGSRGGSGSEEELVLVQPKEWPTDEAAVRDLLGTLEYLSYRARVPGVAQDPARGLDAPRLTVTVTLDGGARWDVRLGQSEPAQGRVWAARGADPPSSLPGGIGDAYLIDEYAARALDRSATDLRDHAPFRGAEDAKRVVLSAESLLELSGSPLCVRWPNRPEGCARADGDRSARLLRRLADLRATRFVDPVPDRSEPPSLVVTADDARLQVYAACPNAPDERLAVSEQEAMCLAAADVDALRAEATDPASWVDRSLVAAPPSRVKRVEIAGTGANGPLVLERRGPDWVAVGPDGAVPVDEDAVRSWIQELAAFRATNVVALDAVPAARDRLASATITSDAGSETLVLIGRGQRARIWRAGEPVALDTHPDVIRYLTADQIQFRDRNLLSFEPYAMASIEYAKSAAGDPAESATRGATASDWTLTAPIQLAADPDTVAALRDVAHDLRATRVLAARPAPEHALRPPRRTLTLTIDPPPAASDGTAPTRQQLVIGARVQGRACAAARPGDDTVYLISADDCDAIDAHLATRSLFEAPSDTLLSISIGAARYERQALGWYDANGQLGDKQAGALLELVDALAVAPDVLSYQPVTTGTTVALETRSATFTLHVSGGAYSLDGRPVRYRLPSGACTTWPALCK